tara:strand:+ start:98 stop:382 length:285 start_codon:yes stop_codon:yes gene_type:complete
MKKNKEVKIIMQVTKLGDQFCSTIVETKSDILTENEVELQTMVRGMIAKLQNDPNDVYMEGIKAFAKDREEEIEIEKKVIDFDNFKKNKNTKLN